jgi:acylphosphatase
LEAQRLGLAGFVRNRGDGSVEGVAEGPRAILEQWVDWCHGGSPAASVDAVDVQWSAATHEFDRFLIARSVA